LDNIRLPYSSINLSYSNAGTIGTSDAEILVSLIPGHRPTEEYVHRLREDLPKAFPGVEFFFQPADIVSHILNFGQPSPIDIQLSDCSNFLVKSKERRYLQPCRAVAAIPDRFSTGIDEHPHQWRWSLQPASIGESRNGNAVDHTSGCESLQHCAHGGRICQRGRARPGWSRG